MHAVLDNFCNAQGTSCVCSVSHTRYMTSHSTILDFITLTCCGGWLTHKRLTMQLSPSYCSLFLLTAKHFALYCIVYSLTSSFNKSPSCISTTVPTVDHNFSTSHSRWVCTAVLQSEQEGNPKYYPAYRTGNSWGAHYSDRQQDHEFCPPQWAASSLSYHLWLIQVTTKPPTHFNPDNQPASQFICS